MLFARSFALLAAPALALAVAFATGCAADPAPQANGYNVELWFEAPPGGLVVGAPEPITVKRIESLYTRCQSDTVCDPRATAPIELVSAACDDDACTVTGSATDDGALVLQAVGVKEGPTTLRVHVRQLATGAELEDAYPIVVHFPAAGERRFAAGLRD